jgi:ParB-like chromosome segregation protein Spo0J
MDDVRQNVCLDRYDERYGYLRLPRPRQEEALGSSMRRYGQLTPIVAAERGECFAVVDGFKRLHAARKIGLEVLEGRVFSLSEQAAIGAVYSLNQHGRGLVDLEEALVVRELCREHGMAQVEVGELLGRHKSWVSRRLMLVERLSEEAQSDVRVGLISTSMVRELVRLPRGNQAEVAVAIHRHGLTVRQGAQFVTLFEKAKDRHEQQALLEGPRQALERYGPKVTMAPVDPRLSSTVNRLRRTAISTVNITSQLRSGLEGADVSSWSDIERSVIDPLLGQARQSILRLDNVLGAIVESSGQ